MPIRQATIKDAEHIAYLTNLAGEGLPVYLWSQQLKAGQSALSFGSKKAAQNQGNFSYKHAQIATNKSGIVQGMILAMTQPAPYLLPDFSELAPQVRPLIELEAHAPGSYYINALGVYERFQGQGVGCSLLKVAELTAASLLINELSLIVASENYSAKRLYEKLGYQTKMSLPVVDFPGSLHGGDWVLMTKPTSPPSF